jgi:hypothetical protein
MTKHAGMTMNERLFEAGVTQEFDSAVKRSDRNALIEIFIRVGIEKVPAEKTAETILTNKKYYGF